MKLTHTELDVEESLYIHVVTYCVMRRRLAMNMSQDELAARAGLSRGAVQHLEHGRHGSRMGTEKRICAALCISVLELEAEVQRVSLEWKAEGRTLAP